MDILITYVGIWIVFSIFMSMILAGIEYNPANGSRISIIFMCFMWPILFLIYLYSIAFKSK
jgi:hypothetical protein